MSVCFCLYKVLPDVDYLGAKYNHATKEELKKMDDLIHSDLNKISLEEDKLLDDFYEERFSDGLKHKYLEVNRCKYLPRYKKYRNKRNSKRLEESFNVKYLETVQGWTYKYLTVDEVLYRQGWFLKSRFFLKSDTFYVATTKEQMSNWFKKYLDVKSTDKRGIECYKAFMDSWEDGMIFYVSF